MAMKLEPPFKTPVLISGFFSKAWELFFRDLIRRQEIVVDTFTTNGSATQFTLSVEPRDEKHTMAFVNGSYRPKFSWNGTNWVPAYTVVGNKITFSSAPASGWLEVTTHGR